MKGPLLSSIRTGQRVGLEVTYMSMNDGYPAVLPQEGMNCEDGCRDAGITKGNFKWFMKRGSRLGAAVPFTVPRHSEKTLVRHQIWQRLSVFLMVQFIVLPVFRCARAFTRTSQQALHKPMGSWSHRDKSVRVEHVRGGPCLSSFLKPYCTPRWRHFLPCMSWAQLLKPSLVSCTEYFMPGFLNKAIFFPEQKKKFLTNLSYRKMQVSKLCFCIV